MHESHAASLERWYRRGKSLDLANLAQQRSDRQRDWLTRQLCLGTQVDLGLRARRIELISKRQRQSLSLADISQTR
jgi:hypothetical protein